MISTNANQSITGPSTCTTLLRRVQADKREAWAIFEAIYHPLIFRWCRRAIPRWQDAEEVAQNVLLAVVKDITKMRYEEPTDTLRGWLRRITQRQLANYFRNDDHRKVGVGGSDFQLLVSNSATTEDEDQEERAILVRSAFELALKGCGAQTREIFWRTMYYQEPPRQVADALGVSIQVVYLAQSRVRGMIRERCVGLVDLDEILGAAE